MPEASGRTDQPARSRSMSPERSTPRVQTVVALAAVMTLLSLLGLAEITRAGISVSARSPAGCVLYQDTVTVHVWVDSLGSGFDGYETVIRFDPDLLEFVSADPESLVWNVCHNEWWRGWETDTATVFISHVALCGGDTLTGPGALSSVTFRARTETAVADIGFDHIEFYRAGNRVPNVASHDGAVVVVEHPDDCVGACCSPTEWCHQARDEQCVNVGGEFLGYLTTCDPDPCPVAACCLGEECQLTREEECDDLGGAWLISWESCDPNPCNPQGCRPDPAPPHGLELAPPQPNPLTGSTLLRYRAPQGATVRLHVLDVGGRPIRRLAEGLSEGLPSTALWDGRDERGFLVASGVYFCRLVVDSQTEVQRIQVIR